MESEQKNETDYVWPPSNYPIFLALVLLAATAVTLAMGEEKRAEELAIYAYYLLVVGVAIRFFELSLPENTLVRLGVVKVRFLGWMLWLVQRIWGNSRNIGSKMRLRVAKIPEVKISNIHRDGFNSISYWFDVSKNATIFLALLLFVVSAVTLAMGDETRAEELVIYAFSLLVIRVALHFLELSLTENTLTRLGVVRVRFQGWMLWLVQGIWGTSRNIGSKLRSQDVRIPGLPEVRLPEVKISNVHREELKNSFAYLSDVSKNVTILLTLAFLIFLIYGLMIDWWTVKGYFTNFVLVILGFFTMYFFTKQLGGGGGIDKLP